MSDAQGRATSRTSSAAWLVGAALLGAALTYLGGRALPRARVSDATTTVADTPAVVGAVRALARLESVSFHMERVIDMRDRQAHLFGLFESEDAVLLVAAVDVVAGVDLSVLRDGDLSIERDTAHVVLPPPIILSARIDGERTYVHSRVTDALALSARTLETRARQEAERSLREAAIDAGILLRARENTERTVRTLLAGLGVKNVRVSFRAE